MGKGDGDGEKIDDRMLKSAMVCSNRRRNALKSTTECSQMGDGMLN